MNVFSVNLRISNSCKIHLISRCGSPFICHLQADKMAALQEKSTQTNEMDQRTIES